MKILSNFFLLIVIVMISFIAEVHATEVTWLNSYGETVSLAKKSNKVIAIYFSGSDWCKPCIKLKKYQLESENFTQYAKENLVLYQADFPVYKKVDKTTKKVNEELAEKYNPKGLFPALVFVDQNQKVIGTIGYIDCKPEDYVLKIESILKLQ